jgi:phosphoglycerate kinase
MEKELKALAKVAFEPEPPLVAIFGGAKVSDKIDLIRHFLGRASAILIGGGMSFTLLRAKGVEIGKSLVEEDKVDLAGELLAEAQARGTRLMLPLDHVVSREFRGDALASLTQDEQVPEDMMALDIGPETVAAYLEVLGGARTVLWNGPMGVFEMEAFASGTLAVAEALAEAADRGAFVLVGGGDSVAAANLAGVSARMSHVSTGGGASLEFLSGLALPGVAALEA